MPEPHWSGYVGMVTGIIGAVLGIVSYRKTSAIKSLDLRIELKKDINTIHETINHANELAPKAYNSKLAAFSARGILNSSVRDKWERKHNDLAAQIERINGELPNQDVNLAKYSQTNLEKELVRIHKLQTTLDPIVSELESNLTP
ncbi:MAG: hypothetical protein JAY74_22485 [Candidatus Thiodiazotropha taylori]|nr:hypothetical protein [Candidatus Thiodiazotropha taylori]